jgi:hypothetical protein
MTWLQFLVGKNGVLFIENNGILLAIVIFIMFGFIFIMMYFMFREAIKK